jgi:hypothetical protein
MQIDRDLQQLGLSCFTGALSCCCLVWRRVELGQDVDLLVSGNGIDQRQPTVGASLGLWASMDPSCCCIHVAGNMHAPVLLCTVYHIIIRKILPRRKGRFRIINNVTYIKLMFLARRRVHATFTSHVRRSGLCACLTLCLATPTCSGLASLPCCRSNELHVPMPSCQRQSAGLRAFHVPMPSCQRASVSQLASLPSHHFQSTLDWTGTRCDDLSI